GPVLAGLIIAMFAGNRAGPETAVPNLRGIGIAFAFDAVTFLASTLTLKLMRQERSLAIENQDKTMLAAIYEGLAYVWRDNTLRTVFLIIAAISVLSIAPINVGVPVISDERMTNGAAAFGVLMSAYGAGSLMGIIGSGVLPRPSASRFGSTLFAAVGVIGFLMMGLAYAHSLWLAALIMLLIGVIDGWAIIQFTTWLQMRAPEVLMGRIMALLMFAFVGLAPVANTFLGWLIDRDVTLVLLISGGLLTLLSFTAAFQPNIRAMGTAVFSASGD
ncbi:MAG: MFS transporter, partial [Chloroflexota bacterium]